MSGYPVLRVGGHDNTIVRRVLGDEPNHAHVDEGGDRWFAVTRDAGDAALIVEAVNGHHPAVDTSMIVDFAHLRQVARYSTIHDPVVSELRRLLARLDELEAMEQRARNLVTINEGLTKRTALMVLGEGP